MNSIIRNRRARGFSLIEVLVAVVILSIGLLALASLQLNMMRASSTTKAQSIAASLAKDKIELIRSFSNLDGYRQINSVTDPALNDSNGSLGGVNYTRVTTVSRYVWDKSVPEFHLLTAAQNTLTDAQIAALSANYVTGKDFKRVSVTVSWADPSGGGARSITLEDLVDSLDPTESGDIMSTSSGGAGPRKVEVKIVDPALDAMVIPIAVGGGTESAASNPKPTVTANAGADTIETRFDVLTYSGVNAGTANVQAKVETVMVGCKCTFDSPPASTVRGSRPTYWNGQRYAPPLFVDSTGAAAYSPPGKVDPAVTGQSTQCGICCRDHFDPVGVKGPTFTPRQVTKNNLDVVTASTHQHYLAGAGNTWTGPLVSGQYSEACRIIRVDGIWSVAADLENDYYNLLATQELSDPKYYASGYAPDATATDNYQAFVVGYLDGRFVTTGTNQSNYNTLLGATPLATLESTNQINLPADVGIATTFTGNLTQATTTGVTKANPGVVTTSSNHGFLNDDRVFFQNVPGMKELSGKSFIIAGVTATTFQLKGINTSAYTTYSGSAAANNVAVNHSKWLHSRGMYVDFLERDALNAIDAAKAGCPSQSGAGYTECVLQVLPFTSINLTELADWTDSSNASVISVLNNNKYNDSATSVEPIRGKVKYTGGASGATASINTTSRKANTSLLDLAQPAISSADNAIFTDTQPFTVGVSADPGVTTGRFYANHPSLAKPSDMAISFTTNSGPSKPCNYVAATLDWTCDPDGDLVNWSNVANAIAIDVTGYNFEQLGVATSAPTTTGCTYAGAGTGFPVKTYNSGGGGAVYDAINYTPKTCKDYNISSATNATISEASGTATVTNSGKKGEVTHIPFVHVTADPDKAVNPRVDLLTLVFTGPTSTTQPLTCTYTCEQVQSNDCKTAGGKKTYFTITAAACP